MIIFTHMSKLSYQELIKQRRAWYKSIKKVYCPCLKEDVVFNSKGFYHLKYDSFGKARSRKERMYKIGLLPLSIPVIVSAKKIYRWTSKYYSKKFNKYIECWALKEVAGKQKTIVTVVLRRIGNGHLVFYSIMKKNDKKLKKLRK